MDALTFVAHLVRAIAWPGVVLVVLIMLRREIRLLLSLVTRLKFKDLELTFGREAAEARAEAAGLPPLPDRPPQALSPPVSATVQQLVVVSPRSAIVEAWREVENAARDAAIRRGALEPQAESSQLGRVANILASRNFLGPAHVGLFHDLRVLRNQAAHAPDFVLSQDAVRDYVEAAARLSEFLRSV